MGNNILASHAKWGQKHAMVFIPEHAEKFRFRRSALFMPASNARALEKARTLSCDTLIFDLEDAVADDALGTAHENLLTLVKGEEFGGRERVIRVSAYGSPTFSEDLAVALACQPDAILLPKVEQAGTIAEVANLAGSDGPIPAPGLWTPAIWAMIETPMALLNLREICAASKRLSCLVVGPNDLAKATGTSMEQGRDAMLPWLMMIIAAARAHGQSVLDGVYNNFRDIDGLAAECAQGASMGFDGKTLIHPSQIDTANNAFGPSEKEIARAQAIVDAFSLPSADGKGAIQINGEMVERLHLAVAERLLRLMETP